MAMALALLPAAPASAYPIDCAIFLCLAGGWPGSADCSAAKAEFLRRVTPYPVEPPLQLWRCPMGVASGSSSQNPMQRLEAIKSASANPTPEPPSAPNIAARIVDASASSSAPPVFGATAPALSPPISARLDLSSADFDIVRSIRVWDVRHYSYRRVPREDICDRRLNMAVGTYDATANFHWSGTAPGPLPSWLPLGDRCDPPSFFRGVGVEWTDSAGIRGHELVRY